MDTYAVFAMNNNGEVVDGWGHRVGRSELIQLIEEFLDDDSVDDDRDDKIITLSKSTIAIVARNCIGITAP